MSDIFIGIDPGSTCTAIVGLNEKGKIVFQKTFSMDGALPDLSRARNFKDNILKWLECLIDKWESPAWNIGIERPGRLAGNGIYAGYAYWTILVALSEWVNDDDNIQYYAPKAIKKFVTGKGNTPRDILPAKIIRRWGGVDFDVHDLYVAYAIAQLVRSEG